MRIIVGGFIGSFCISGITWHYAQYVAGLHLLGHDVYYIEDTCGVNAYQHPDYEWGDPTPVVNYLSGTMDFFGLSNRWAFRDAITGKCFGLSEKKVLEICETADAIISVSNAVYLRDEYLKIPIRVLVDTDPMFTQLPVEVAKVSLSNFTHHFTFGTNMLNDDSCIPTLGFQWLTTRQPICMEYWKNHGVESGEYIREKKFTTIMNLSSKSKLVYENVEYGQKDVELEKIVDLPLIVPEVIFEMCIAGASSKYPDHNWLVKKGWNLSNNLPELNDRIHLYNAYIKNSDAEFSVAKETYVKAKTGWFSDRSACYLAAGRPAIVQETQWSKFIPSGKGLISFTSIESAAEAVNEVSGNYKPHSRTAKDIAHEYFDSMKVLSDLVNQLN